MTKTLHIIRKGLAIFIISILLLVLAVLALIQTRPVQNYAREKVVSFLENKLETKVAIGRLKVSFPKILVLEDVYIEDRTQDTLLAGRQLKVNINLLKLLNNEIQINEVNLNGITIKVNRQLPDTVFNYQFIIDAFASEKEKPEDKKAMKMAIKKIIIDDTRAVFFDVLTGNDVDLYLAHLDTRIRTFDPVNLRFDAPRLNVIGLTGKVSQTSPLTVQVVKDDTDPADTNERNQFLQLSNQQTRLQDIDIAYSNEVSGIETKVKFKELKVFPEKIDLENNLIALRKIELNEFDGAVAINSKAESDIIKLTTQNDQELDMEYLPWKFTVGAIRLNNNHIVFDDNTKPRTSRGMDFAHLVVRELTLHADQFLFNRDTIAAHILKGSMREGSGFEILTLKTEMQYTSKGVRLEKLLIVTPDSEIKSGVAIGYPSIEAVQEDVSLLEFDLNLQKAHVRVSDILTFVPGLAVQHIFSDPTELIHVDGRLSGSLARFSIHELQFSGFSNTRGDLTGTATNITDPNNYVLDLSIRNISSTREDILSFLPPGTVPDRISLPETMSLSGIVRGEAADTYVKIAIATSFGDAAIDGDVHHIADSSRAAWDVDLSMQEFDVGRLIQQPETVGKVRASVAVKGTGYDPRKGNASIKGMVQRAEYKDYAYQNIRIDADLQGGLFTAEGGMRDPNLHFSFQASGDLRGEHPGFDITAHIDSLKTGPLNLTEDPMIFRGKIAANFPEMNLDALNGQILVSESIMVFNDQRINLDAVEVVAAYENNQQLLTATTPFLHAALNGEYKISQLGAIFINAIQPYYAVFGDTVTMPPGPYQFTLDAHIADHPSLRALMPELRRTDSISLAAAFSDREGWNATLLAPYILVGENKIEGLNITATTQGDTLMIAVDAAEIGSGEYLAMTAPQFDAEIADDKIDFSLRIGDKAGIDRYAILGLFAKAPGNKYVLSFRPEGLLLNYEAWSIGPDNQIRFGPEGVWAADFDLGNNNQHLIISSETADDSSPLEVRFADFRLATLTGFFQKDTLLADGTLNGTVFLSDLSTQPNFTTDLTVSNLAINRDTIGDLNAKIDNLNAKVFAANVSITGRGNDLALTGAYHLKPAGKSVMDLNLDIKSLQLNTLEGASMGTFSEGKGFMSGNVNIGGSLGAPNIDGELRFNQTSVVVTMLNNEFRIDDEQIIAVDNAGLRFNAFTVRDFSDNQLTINGMAFTKNYLNYRFDLNVQARNFRGLNSAKTHNELYYGQLFFDADLHLSGVETAPVVDGTLRINEDSRLTFILPQSKPGVVEREGVVVFTDKDAPANDSLFMAALDTLNQSSLLGMEVSVNIEIDKKAELNLVIDEGNGDYIQLLGEAALNAGIDKSGKITLTGSYELEQGAYEMSFNLLRRRFDIQKGSTITWASEPTDGTLDIAAVYVARASVVALIQDQITAATTDLRYRQRLPFEVRLHMTGPLLKPELSFDISLPPESSVYIDNEIAGQVEMRLSQLKAEPSELNKQVFALLLLNRFVAENPFASAGGAINASTLARQSVSKLLTEQLNNLADNLISGVDLNFDLVSSEDYTSGSMQNKTDLNVGLSKRLLNDRLNVSVGTNFELEGGRQTNESGTAGSSTSPNVSVEYFLTQNGAYLIRAYRRNEYEGIVEGYVVETGVGFVMSVDYNRFREIFERRKIRQELAKEKRKAEK